MLLNSYVDIFGCLYTRSTIQFNLPLLRISIKCDSSLFTLQTLRSFQTLRFKSEEIKRSIPLFSDSVGVLSRLWL